MLSFLERINPFRREPETEPLQRRVLNVFWDRPFLAGGAAVTLIKTPYWGVAGLATAIFLNRFNENRLPEDVRNIRAILLNHLEGPERNIAIIIADICLVLFDPLAPLAGFWLGLNTGFQAIEEFFE